MQSMTEFILPEVQLWDLCCSILFELNITPLRRETDSENATNFLF